MAEYYPLLAKAVAGLTNSTPDARRAIYDRARKALLGQLNALEPPIAAADIERETRALDDAAARLEQEISGGSVSKVVSKAADAPRQKLKPLVPRPASDGPSASEVTTSSAAPSEAADEFDDDPSRVRPLTQRPFAPQPPAPTQSHRQLWIVAAVVAFVVIGVAIAAWKLRDHPEEIAKSKPPPTQADTSSGKIVNRVGGTPSSTADATAAAQQQANTAGTAAPDTANPPLPVAYRAALLVEAPDEPSKVKTYVGTAIWHLDTVSGANQPVSTAVRVDIDVPEAKMQARIVLRKNFDATLPASHTMTITFTIDPSGPLSNVKQISTPQMRKEGSPTGESLSGVPVPITENSFLVGLSPGSFEAGNLASLQNNQWIDIPMLLTNGRIAKLTFEKGTAGQRAIDDAVASWQSQGQGQAQ